LSLNEEVPQTNHTAAAQARVEEIRAMRQAIPNFVFPVTKSDRRRLTSAATLPPQFVELTAVAMKNSPSLVRGGGVDPAQTRDLMTFAEAYEPLADELEALAKFVRHTVTAARNKAGSDALLTYAVAQRLAKRPETADLAPHVDDMRTALGRRGGIGRRAPRKPKTEPQPAPAPAAVIPDVTEASDSSSQPS
jgi:hypothetical protein